MKIVFNPFTCQFDIAGDTTGGGGVTSVNGQTGAVSLDTDDIAEGSTNLYFTNARAQAASISQVITNGVTTKSPSEDAVFDALALKQSTTLADAHILVGNASNIATDVAMSGDISISNTGATAIVAGVIVNADINAAAAIDATKISDGSVSNAEFLFINSLTSNAQTQLDAKLSTTLADGKILVGNASNLAIAVTPSGDLTMTNTGDFQIASGVIVNADINASAAIDASKIADGTVSSAEFQFINTLTSNAQTQINGKLTTALTSAHIFVGNGSAVATDVAVSGDITLANTGEMQIATGVIVNADINASAAIDASKIADGTVSSAEFQFINSLTSNAQTQIDGKLSTTLADGKIYIGNGSNVATAVTPSGGLTITNAGVVSIAFTNSLGNASSEYFGSGATGSGIQQTVMGNAANGSSGTNNTIYGRASSGSTAGGDVIIGQSSSAGAGGGACGLGNNVTIGTGATGMGAVCNIQKDSVGMGSGTVCADTVTGRNIAVGKTATISGTSNNCLAIGTNALIPTGLTNVAVIGSDQTAYTEIYIGQGYTSTGLANIALQVTPRTGSNVAGGSLTVKSGNGTGTGGSGSIIFQTAPVAASSSTANTLTTVGQVTNAGVWTLGAASTTPTHIINGAVFTSGIATGTLLNTPTAGNPAGYLTVTINGTTSYIPFWQ